LKLLQVSLLIIFKSENLLFAYFKNIKIGKCGYSLYVKNKIKSSAPYENISQKEWILNVIYRMGSV
jgi:hypothetical protein